MRDMCICCHFAYSTFTSLYVHTAQHARHVHLLPFRPFYIHVSACIYSTTQAACVLIATLCDAYSCPREGRQRAHSPVSPCRLISYHNYVCACIWLQWSVYIGTPHGFMHVWFGNKCGGESAERHMVGRVKSVVKERRMRNVHLTLSLMLCVLTSSVMRFCIPAQPNRTHFISIFCNKAQ